MKISDEQFFSAMEFNRDKLVLWLGDDAVEAGELFEAAREGDKASSRRLRAMFHDRPEAWQQLTDTVILIETRPELLIEKGYTPLGSSGGEYVGAIYLYCPVCGEAKEAMSLGQELYCDEHKDARLVTWKEYSRRKGDAG